MILIGVKVVVLQETCHVTSAGSGIDQSATSIQILQNAEAKLDQVSDDVTRKIGPLDFTKTNK